MFQSIVFNYRCCTYIKYYQRGDILVLWSSSNLYLIHIQRKCWFHWDPCISYSDPSLELSNEIEWIKFIKIAAIQSYSASSITLIFGLEFMKQKLFNLKLRSVLTSSRSQQFKCFPKVVFEQFLSNFEIHFSSVCR